MKRNLPADIDKPVLKGGDRAGALKSGRGSLGGLTPSFKFGRGEGGRNEIEVLLNWGSIKKEGRREAYLGGGKN